MIGVSTWQDVSFSFLLNGIILLYCMLPGVRSAFGTASDTHAQGRTRRGTSLSINLSKACQHV